MLTKSIGDDERRRSPYGEYIGASLRVATVRKRWDRHRRASSAFGSNDSSSTYLLVIRHRRQFLAYGPPAPATPLTRTIRIGSQCWS